MIKDYCVMFDMDGVIFDSERACLDTWTEAAAGYGLENIKSDDFDKLISGKLDPVVVFTLGKLKVDGDVGKALEFSNFAEMKLRFGEGGASLS